MVTSIKIKGSEAPDKTGVNGIDKTGKQDSFGSYTFIDWGEGKDKIEETKGVGKKVTKI